jgi:RNA polymerase sigma-70 factor (ECF subfamily)
VFDEAGDDEPAVDPTRFRPAGEPLAGHWASPVRDWDEEPEERLLAAETRALVGAAIAELPSGQRAVITMRDVEGCAADEVCNVIGLTETNQRVLLHRARSRVRRALEAYLDRA